MGTNGLCDPRNFHSVFLLPLTVPYNQAVGTMRHETPSHTDSGLRELMCRGLLSTKSLGPWPPHPCFLVCKETTSNRRKT